MLYQEENVDGVRVPAPVMVFSPDGLLLAVRSNNKIKFWDVETGRLIKILEGHTDKIAGLAFSSDGAMLASGSSTVEKKIVLWNVADGNIIREIPGFAAKNLQFTPEGEILITAWEDDTLRFWKVEDGSLLLTLQGIQGTAVLSPDGASIAFIACNEKVGTRCNKQVVNLYRISDGVIYRTLPGLQNLIQDVIWSPDSKHIILASDYAILEWDIESSTTVQKLDPGGYSRKTIMNLAFNPQHTLLLAIGEDDTIFFWSYPQGSLQTSKQIQHTSFVFSPLGKLMAFLNNGSITFMGTGN